MSRQTAHELTLIDKIRTLPPERIANESSQPYRV
jgi:hypothetical protein